jgi:murein DD-endopeptidase MepM/ murein hydrolase activator NlpD
MQSQYFSQHIPQLAALLISLILTCASYADTNPLIKWRGSWQQGGLLLGQVQSGTTLSHRGELIKTTIDGQFLFGLGRNAAAVSTFLVTDKAGVATEVLFEVAARSYNIQRVEGVPQRTVEPPAGQLQRIRSDSALVREARRLVTDETDFLSGFIKPLEGPITGVYGSQRFYNGVPKSPHYGLDYAAPTGTIVVAPAAGIVRMAHDDLFYSGGTLIIDHGHGLSSSFLHLSEMLVEKGDRVQRGDPIARVGSTGRATGAHLDWRMNWLNQRVDPALVLESFPVQ